MGCTGSKDKTPNVWYFAIGSMMNPISLKGRALAPVQSVPAELLDCELQFFGPEGMAKAVTKEGTSFHGVLHLMTAEDMAKLDKIEGVDSGFYERTQVKAKLYDGKVQPCTVYMEGKKM